MYLVSSGLHSKSHLRKLQCSQDKLSVHTYADMASLTSSRLQRLVSGQGNTKGTSLYLSGTALLLIPGLVAVATWAGSSDGDSWAEPLIPPHPLLQ